MTANVERRGKETRSELVADGLGMPAFPLEMVRTGQELGTHIMGATVLAWIGRHPVEEWGVGWLDGGTLSMRFRRHLEKGDRLVKVVRTDGNEMTFELRAADSGELCADGRATTGRPSEPLWSGERAPLPDHLLDPGLELEIGQALGSVDVSFDAMRDQVFLANLPLGDPWRTMSCASPAWLVSAANALIRRSVAFPLGQFVHAGVEIRSIARIRSGAALFVSGRVVERFDRAPWRFALIEIEVVDGGVVHAVLDMTVAYVP